MASEQALPSAPKAFYNYHESFAQTCETFGGKFRPSCILHGHAHCSDRQQPGALEPAALDETETPVAILVMMFKTHGCLGLGEERCCIEPSIRTVCDAAIYSYSDSIPGKLQASFSLGCTAVEGVRQQDLTHYLHHCI
jgi:hypothetical protein